MFGPAKQRVLCQLPIQAMGGLALLARREGAAGFAQHASKVRTGKRRRFVHGFFGS